ncbi:hypothetical protein APY04_3239 [Hyphomicrobium sulfonivorans]|uniref:Oligosaccharide repeat unit polymerase n=1 Tax=Hyphomicrobium sulfonivorans TaxID=121290 RepID=A0A109B9B4_HYPSL|nr:hypothetical protein [Hyphomicrobium sulfonivorans]KWT64571.1 hypothetical protein APY04_3239 [Hyphomicrobium sulfonivorans]
MEVIKKSIFTHSPLVLMLVVTSWLTLGAAATGHLIAVLGLLIFGAVLAGTYAALNTFPVHIARPRSLIAGNLANALVWLVGLTAIAISLIHYIWFDGFTLFSAGQAEDNVGVALVRQNATASLPSWMMYANQITSRCLFPIAAVLALWRGKYALAVCVLAFGLLYSACLLQKSGPILLLLPSILLLIYKRHYFFAGIGATTALATVLALGFLGNPGIRTPQSVTGSLNNASTLSNSLLFRVAIVPGEVASEWFSVFPEKRSFGYGCGYRFLAPLVDCEFQNYARLIYDDFYKVEVSKGLQGTVNAASMMTAYANFGWPGLVGSAVLHALIAWVLMMMFARTPELLLPINATYIFLLSSGDLFTMLLSGGWGLAIFLGVYVYPPTAPREAAFAAR